MKYFWSFFDYIAFRIYFFYWKAKDNSAAWTAVLFVSLLQGTMLGSIGMVTDFIYGYIAEIDKRYLNKYVIGIPLAILLLAFNSYRYYRKNSKSRVQTLCERFEDRENKSEWSMWLIFPLPVLFLFGTAFILHFIGRR
jgi:hypothetical protein